MQLLLASCEKVRCPYGEHFKRPVVTDEPVMFISHTVHTQVVHIISLHFHASLTMTHTHHDTHMGMIIGPLCHVVRCGLKRPPPNVQQWSTMTYGESAICVPVSECPWCSWNPNWCLCASEHRKERQKRGLDKIWGERFHQSLVKFAGVPAFSLLIALRISCLIKYGRVQASSALPRPHTLAHISPLLSHEVLVCYQSDFLSQIFISNQSSWLNLKSEPVSINHITCLTPIMAALISHRNETPPWVYVRVMLCVWTCFWCACNERGK